MKDGLSFKVLRKSNELRLSQFKIFRASTLNKKINWNLEQWILNLTGEVGKAYSIIKGIKKDNLTIEEIKEDLTEQLAYIQIHLDILANEANIDLGKATIDKFNKISDSIINFKKVSNIKISNDGHDYYIEK